MRNEDSNSTSRVHPSSYHVIRLRGPWQIEPLARYVGTGASGHNEETRDLPRGGKTQVPGDWAELLGADFCGRVRYTRRFNCPTNLEPSERVWLVLEGIDHEAVATLNRQPLGRLRGGECPHRLEITPVLLPHNLLSLEVCLSPEVFGDAQARGERAGRAGGLVGEVRLEIGRGATT